MTVDTASPSVFDAGLPTLDYDFTTTPAELYPRLLAAQQQAPIAVGPFGPEVLSYELVRTVLRDSRFQIPPGLGLAAKGPYHVSTLTGPDRVVIDVSHVASR